MKKTRPLALLGGVIVTCFFPHSARCAGTDAPAGLPVAAATTPIAPPTLDSIIARVAQGRDLLQTGDKQSLGILRATSQGSLATLNAAAVAAESAENNDPTVRSALRRAARSAREAAATAHLAWGEAADRFGLRDEAITALARALDLANQAAPAAVPTKATNLPNSGLTTLQSEAGIELNNALKKGLPLVAAGDALQIIAAQAHGGLWTPVQSTFMVPSGIYNPLIAPSVTGIGPGKPDTPRAVELLVTSGKLFPPENKTAERGEARLIRIPPLFKAVPRESLPASLKMDRMAVGYTRESNGPNRGLWRQTVRVFYASPYATKDNRDDRPRAEALCLQFLRVAAMVRNGLGLTNPYNADGVTTLWLSEVSAWWPVDDDEPSIASQFPPPMPQPNTPLLPHGPIQRDVETTPFLQPWRAAATLDSAPGDILFFKMTQPRPEAEWLRQLIHEYGHVTIPPFDNFEPPIEPYGNGLIGESLGVVWAASTPESWALAPDSTRDAPATDELPHDMSAYIAQSALPALVQWQKSGPLSALRTDRTQKGLQYLTGLAIYIERVYGAPLLGKALAPLVQRARPDSANGNVPLTADALLNSSASVLRNTMTVEGRPVLPIWLGGVLDARASPASLVARAPLQLTEGTAAGWIFVPASANKLNITWHGDSPAASIQPVGWRLWPGQRETVGGNHVLTLVTANRSGWQKLALAVKGGVTISAASFEQWLE